LELFRLSGLLKIHPVIGGSEIIPSLKALGKNLGYVVETFRGLFEIVTL